jgi:hypothetical protein
MGWLYRIHGNAVAAEQRRLVQGGQNQELGPIHLASNGDAPDDIVANQEEARWIWDQLPEEEKELVRDLDTHQTAKEMAHDRGQTVSQVYHSVQQLRDKVERLTAAYRPPRKRRVGRRPRPREFPQ